MNSNKNIRQIAIQRKIKQSVYKTIPYQRMFAVSKNNFKMLSGFYLIITLDVYFILTQLF